jgi:hypothetical protein
MHLLFIFAGIGFALTLMLMGINHIFLPYFKCALVVLFIFAYWFTIKKYRYRFLVYLVAFNIVSVYFLVKIYDYRITEIQKLSSKYYLVETSPLFNLFHRRSLAIVEIKNTIFFSVKQQFQQPKYEIITHIPGKNYSLILRGKEPFRLFSGKKATPSIDTLALEINPFLTIYQHVAGIRIPYSR